MENKNKIIKIIGIIIGAIVIIIGGIFLYKKLTEKPAPEPSSDKEKVTPLLYEVSKEGTNTKIYLFGSIHVAQASTLEFPKYILDAYKKSDYLACEINEVEYLKDQDKLTEDIMNLMYQDGTTLKDHLDSKIYEKLINFLKENNLYSEIVESYKPSLIDSLISSKLITDSGLNPNDGIDIYFINMAMKDNKTIIEIEDYSSQLNLLDSFPEKLYSMRFTETIDNYSKNIEGMKKLYQAWKNGNKEELLDTLDDDMEIKDKYTKEEINIIKDYNKKLIDDRNKLMTDKAIELFNNNQNVFYMVGAAHIITDTGLVKSLQEKGFTVKQIKEA